MRKPDTLFFERPNMPQHRRRSPSSSSLAGKDPSAPAPATRPSGGVQELRGGGPDGAARREVPIPPDRETSPNLGWPDEAAMSRGREQFRVPGAHVTVSTDPAILPEIAEALATAGYPQKG